MKPYIESLIQAINENDITKVMSQVPAFQTEQHYKNVIIFPKDIRPISFPLSREEYEEYLNYRGSE